MPICARDPTFSFSPKSPERLSEGQALRALAEREALAHWSHDPRLLDLEIPSM